MEWLWLLLAIIGLGLLWGFIIGIEKLTKRIKMRDDQAKTAVKQMHARIAKEEAEFMRVQKAKEYLSQSMNDEILDSEEMPAEYGEAVAALSTSEFVDTVVRNIFGTEQSADKITADRSAFAQQPAKVAVANGQGVLPIKARPSGKDNLTKQEAKIYKKLKQKS